MKTALITGITGQDGSYLAEFLLSKGYGVIGATRNVEKAYIKMPASISNRIKCVQIDMHNQQSISHILDRYRPSEVYNLAALTSGAAMFNDPVLMCEVNGAAVVRILEAIREVDSGIRFCQASSREVFGEAVQTPQTESTARSPRSPYGAAKAYADSMVKIYRDHYGIFACSTIFYNHESARRGPEFVTKKITSTAAKIKLGLANEIHLGNLEALRDWGYAEDYVRGMWLMMQQWNPDDFIFATGEVHSVRDFCACAFEHLGLDYRAYIKSDPVSYRVAESAILVGNAEKARRVLGWLPTLSFREIIARMVDVDLDSLRDIHGS